MLEVQVASLEHLRYCPRQCALVVVDAEWADNEHTIRGQRGHRRADQLSHRRERGVLVVRAVPVHSELLGLLGRADAVEIHPDGELRPVEYKMGTRHGDAAEVQLCGIALCLEEMTGTLVRQGAVWYRGMRRRENVVFDEDLRRRTLDAIEEVRTLMASPDLPPAPADERCRHCSFEPTCLPDLVADPRRVVAYVADEIESCDY